ncbi:hypothetical protein R3P38DRAFT_3144573 [Favolaschia claudopus]|uniref:Chromo domain-containing protein n=1 Tax=Favolaschia claudopus TaxID=2862362 RepID=A0AAV9Z536_9AGAR
MLYVTIQLEYLVRWKGYGSGDDSWVAAKDMNASEEIREYERKSAQNKRQQPTTPRPAKPVKLSRRSGRNRFDGSDNAESTDTNACVPAEPPLTIEPVPMQPFLPHLLRLWMEPPLCHYLVARESVLSALTLLSQFPSALLSRSTFPVPPCAEFPTSSLIMEDLLSREYSCYHDLGSDQRSEAKVAVVVEMLSKSYLLESSQPEDKIVGVTHIPATRKGLLRCCLDWSAVLGPLAHHDQSVVSGTSQQSLPSPQPYSTRTPPGLGSAIVHCDGEALWLVWPGTPSNLHWWTQNHRHPSHGCIPEAIKVLDGLELMFLTEPCSFVLPPFAIYWCIGFSLASYTCVSFASAAHWTVAQDGLATFKEAATGGCALDVMQRLLTKTQTWDQILQPAGPAASYLTEWKSHSQRVLGGGAVDDGRQLQRSQKYQIHPSVSHAINARCAILGLTKGDGVGVFAHF